MEIIWSNSKQEEIKHLLSITREIIKGNNQEMGIFLFTEKHEDLKTPYNILPKWKKNLNSEFVKSLSEAKDQEISEILISDFENNFEEIIPVKNDLLEKFKADWNKIESTFLKDLNYIFPKLPFDQIIITPTNYGLRGWHYIENGKLHIAHRADFPIDYIITTILSEIIINNYIKKKSEEDYYQGELWTEKEAITTFLFRNTLFSHYLPNYLNVEEQMNEPEIDLELKILSDENYKSIGFPVKKGLKLNGLIVKINEENLTNLSETQNNILINLLRKEGEIVKNEEIAEIMWGKDYFDKYSLSAMAKMIHQLRGKLKEVGLQKEVIFTKRGKGYILIQ